jgi:hypothetical protein
MRRAVIDDEARRIACRRRAALAERFELRLDIERFTA